MDGEKTKSQVSLDIDKKIKDKRDKEVLEIAFDWNYFGFLILAVLFGGLITWAWQGGFGHNTPEIPQELQNQGLSEILKVECERPNESIYLYYNNNCTANDINSFIRECNAEILCQELTLEKIVGEEQ